MTHPGLSRLFLFLPFLLFIFPPGAPSWEGPFVTRKNHWAVTGEKFELALERLHLKKTRRRIPVILSHGFLVNSRFMNLDPDHSLAEYLAQEGFDVWNLSFRGTGRSLNPLRGGAKKWSLDDMIDKDLSAVIRYVQNETKRNKISWVGFDMGGLLAYGYLEKNSRTGLATLVTIGAPVIFSRSEQEPMKTLLKLEESPAMKKAFLYLDGPLLGRLLIPLLPKIEKLFYNPENIEPAVKEKLLQAALAPINPGVLDHLLLMIKRGEFVSANGDFNYRKELRKVRIPTLLIGGQEDPLAPPRALRTTFRALGAKERNLKIIDPRSKDAPGYGHFDLILGKRSRKEVFPVIGRWLKRRDGRK